MKTSKKFSCLLLLLVIAGFLVIGSVNAENQKGIINHKPNAPLLEAQIDNNTYYGVCLNHEKEYPKNTEYTITNGAGNTSDHVKNIIIKYYRENNTDRYNSLIQYAVWGSINGKPTVYMGMTQEEKVICLQMYNNQTGVVGNTYTDENGIKYIFTFKYGTPLKDFERQNALIFSYITEIEEIPNDSNNETINDTINDTIDDTIDDPIDDPYEGNLNKNIRTISSGDSIKGNPNNNNYTVTNDDPKEKNEKAVTPVDPSEPKNNALASMKTTGMSIIAVLLMLLSSLGFVIRKK